LSNKNVPVTGHQQLKFEKCVPATKFRNYFCMNLTQFEELLFELGK